MENSKEDELYNVLGVERTSSSSEIRSAYRKLAMKWHPDKCTPSDDENAKDKFQGIQEAYSVLSDDKKRVLYDSGLYDEGDDEGMQSFMSEMVSMMSANTSKSSFGELKDMFDQMVDSYASTSSGSPTSSVYSDVTNLPTSSVKSGDLPPLFGHFTTTTTTTTTTQSFCMGVCPLYPTRSPSNPWFQRQEDADNSNKQRLPKKHRRRRAPYEQGPRASTCNRVD